MSTTGAVECNDCTLHEGAGYWSDMGATSCSLCREGYYQHPSDDSCRPCPHGATCPAEAILATLVIDPAFFRFSSDSDRLYECLMGKVACPGTVAVAEATQETPLVGANTLNGTSSTETVSPTAAPLATHGEALCATGYR